MNAFYGKRILNDGSLSAKLVQSINYLGGIVIGIGDIKQGADFAFESDETSPEKEKKIRQAGIPVYPLDVAEHWIEEAGLISERIENDRIDAIVLSKDVRSDNTALLLYELRLMANELKVRRQLENKSEYISSPPEEVKVDLEIVADKTLDKYCEVSDLDTLFLYEIRKIAREAKRARKDLSAQRWDALLSSPAIRILGSAGVTKDQRDSGYAHFGMEIWSLHPSRTSDGEPSEYGRGILTQYADIVIKNNARAESISVKIIDNYVAPGYRKGVVHGPELQFELPELELDAILHETSPEQQLVMLRASLLSRGVNTDVELVISNAAFK